MSGNNANRNGDYPLYTFSLRYTQLSWKTWAEPIEGDASLTAHVQYVLGLWKEFAEKHQMDVLDGYGVDIRDVDLLSEGLDNSK